MQRLWKQAEKGMCGLGILPWKKKLLSDTELADIRKIQQDDVLPWGDAVPEAQ